MVIPSEIAKALVSVIIPCYNQAHFLEEAINSVLRQSWPYVEVIVVDDGSTDATRLVATNFINRINYVYQENQGLSKAGNTGIKKSRGQFLVMLDADDWLYPEAISKNIYYLIDDPALAFVSGSYDFVDVTSKLINEIYNPIHNNHYIKLLEGNYIGSPASVMYRRWGFDFFEFDSKLKVCEDYDLYLKVARDYPITHHTAKIAAYGQHVANMSANIPLMLSTTLQVLQKHGAKSRSEDEQEALKRGVRNITNEQTRIGNFDK